METSTNLSISMTDIIDQENTASLLNHNVSFNSSLEQTLARSGNGTRTGMDSSMNSFSFSLTEDEKQKLKKSGLYRNGLDRSSAQLRSVNNKGNVMESSVAMDEFSTLEDSERIINIEDTLDELPSDAELKKVPVPDPSDTKHAYFQKQLVELGRRCWSSTAQAQHYTKGCYWSPDGTCLLAPVHLDGMHVMELPLDLYGANNVALDRGLSQLQSAVHVPEGGTVYDCVWYPHMNSQDPDSCFWIATRQHEPIHMWDAFDGRLRCSYSGYDEVDEVVAAISLAFSSDSQKIYAGYKRCIKIFDTNRPGRSYDEYAVKFAVSCIAQTSEHPHTVTCGNWKGYIQHFDLRCAPNQGPLFTLGGHSAGITQLRYANSSAGNWRLFSGARKCPKLLQWDMRNYKKPLNEFQREVNTNQRIQFDLSPQQSWLASGDTSGALNLWNLEQEDATEALKLILHEDCCNGISFHPTLPILASSSGQYHFIAGDNHESLFNATTPDLEQELEQQSTIEYENAVLLLWYGHSDDLSIDY